MNNVKEIAVCSKVKTVIRSMEGMFVNHVCIKNMDSSYFIHIIYTYTGSKGEVTGIMYLEPPFINIKQRVLREVQGVCLVTELVGEV